MKKGVWIIALIWICLHSAFSQGRSTIYTRADTLRGSITPERSWWDVLRYDLAIHPDYLAKAVSGSNVITFKVIKKNHPLRMQIDLQPPQVIDSIILDGRVALPFTRDGNAYFARFSKRLPAASTHHIRIVFSGKAHEAIRAPWDGGWTFAKDSLGRPWMTVTCQGLGASIWYPCKDHQGDEPDNGASLAMTVPDSLVAVGNGRLQQQQSNGNGTTTYKWAVVNPINNYCIIPYIGKYVHFHRDYAGEKGKLDMDYWVLDYNLEKARTYLPNTADSMMKSFEYWFGPFPWYEDGYKLVDVQHTGMEHQSAVAYGNHYDYGYRGRDGSGTGWGKRFDFIVVHESGHEWFGNNITTKDLADMWVHEGFTNYSETLYVDYMFGEEAGNAYNAGIRRGIRNDRPIIPPYNVNAQGSGDMYPKAGNMLHAIRHSINNDTLFRSIMRGLNKTFYHKTVTSDQVEKYISRQAKYDFDPVFDQYLRTTQIPTLEYHVSNTRPAVRIRWTNCVAGFNLPLVLKNKTATLRIIPTTTFEEVELTEDQVALFNEAAIEKMYYINATARLPPL